MCLESSREILAGWCCAVKFQRVIRSGTSLELVAVKVVKALKAAFCMRTDHPEGEKLHTECLNRFFNKISNELELFWRAPSSTTTTLTTSIVFLIHDATIRQIRNVRGSWSISLVEDIADIWLLGENCKPCDETMKCCC